MSAIHRNITRTILDDGTPDETTRFTQTPSSDPLLFALTTAQKFLLGFKLPFSTRHFNFKTLNTVPNKLTVKYFNGTDFQPVEDVIDQTIGFTRSGFLSWVNINDWRTTALSPIDDKELYWIEVTTDTNLSVGTELESVLNLFCDQDLLRRAYPDLVADTRYLPPGRTDFIEQLILGTDEVIKRLKRDKIILDEADLIDINEVSDSAVHFTAFSIYRPIAVSEADIAMRDKAFDDGHRELNGIKLDIDVTGDGIIDAREEDIGDIFVARS